MPRQMSRPRQHPWYQRKDTPTSRPVSRPRTTRPGPWPSPARPGGPAGTAPPPSGQQDEPVTWTGTGGRHRAAAPGHTLTTDPGDKLIIGIADAASYLGYDKPDSFRRARTRHPIPGEGKTGDGRPCWTPAALRSWQSKRKIAGNRSHGDDSG